MAGRVDRDVGERGRTPEGVRAQVEGTVAPMHEVHVVPCRDLADLTLDGQGDRTANLAILLARVEGAGTVA